jgi:hypothetical protein
MFLSLVAGTLARAQAPEGSDRMTLMAVADSVSVLKKLDYAVRDNAKDAAAWYRRGMVAWALYERSLHQPPPHGLYWPTLTTLADTSLRRALELEPDNDKYFVAVAHFLLQSGVTFRTYGAYGVFDAEMKRVRASGDAATIARTAVEAARLHWLRFDRQTCRRIVVHEPGLPAPALEGAPAPRGVPPVFEDYTGEVDYIKAELLLREAYVAAPTDPRVFRQLAMVLSVRLRWRELASTARDHIQRAPHDGWGYMAMGLAQHRIGNARASATAFDSGFVVLGDSVRHFLDRFERGLDSASRVAFAANSPEARTKVEAVYWRNADPIWSVDGTEPRAEFLARVTFAQLRWGSDELTLDGVTSDFGNVYMRTGKWQAGEADAVGHFWRPPGSPPDLRIDICVPQVKPWYFAGDSTVPEGSRASWGNIAKMRIDSIPTQVARFRAAFDSTDVLVATAPPVTMISRFAQVKGPVRTDFWLLANGTDDVARDSVRPSVQGVQQFRHRLSPGMYVYRAEASADGGLLAARSTAGFIAGNDSRTGFATNGFGMSDVLLTSRATARSAARRWSDFDVTPLVGAVVKKAQITIVWETYELGSSNGAAKYNVDITMHREETPQSVPGRIAASIIGAIGSAVGVTRSKDEVEFKYDRSAPHAAAVVDNITLSLGDTPAGVYLLTLRITDQVTGKTTGRSQTLRIVDPARR